MERKFHLATVEPTIDITPNVAISHANDILFDWFAFEIPKGAAHIKNITCVITGTDAVAADQKDFDLYFARSIDGTAPTSLGNPNAAVTAATGSAVRKNIIGRHALDSSIQEDADAMISYNVWTLSGKTGNDRNDVEVILQGDPEYTSTEGYQTIWVSGIAIASGANFGTGVLVNGAVSSAGAQTIAVDGTDPNDCFQIGDELLACRSTGASVQKIGTLTAMASDGSSITVDAKDINGTTVWDSGALEDDDEVCFRRPITIHMSLEY